MSDIQCRECRYWFALSAIAGQCLAAHGPKYDKETSVVDTCTAARGDANPRYQRPEETSR